MRLIYSLLLTILIFSNANAFEFKSVELINSTTITSDQISSILINNFDSSINSLVTVDGDLIQGTEIKSIHLFNSKKLSILSVKKGGDSGD